MIKFTQFIAPHGRQKTTYFDHSSEVNDKALSIIGQGGRFTSEVLTTGQVSLACEYGDRDVAIQSCNNDAGIREAVKTLVDEAAVVIENFEEDDDGMV